MSRRHPPDNNSAALQAMLSMLGSKLIQLVCIRLWKRRLGKTLNLFLIPSINTTTASSSSYVAVEAATDSHVHHAPRAVCESCRTPRACWGCIGKHLRKGPRIRFGAVAGPVGGFGITRPYTVPSNACERMVVSPCFRHSLEERHRYRYCSR